MVYQDDYYLNKEGDGFFSRNFEGKDLPVLRDNKKSILAFINETGVEFNSVIEFGCNYGDLLNYFSVEMGKTAVGVEASKKAVEQGLKLYGDNISLYHGIINDNCISSDPNNSNNFDLAIVEDVFSWVSRETILSSVLNVNNLIREGGYLFIRDFKPNRHTKNRNHHVADTDVFNFKVLGGHCQILLSTGTYEIVSEKVYYDNTVMSSGYKCDNPFNYRWSDILLQKKTTEYFDEVKRN